MNSCATAVSDEYPDIVFSYGFDDEYRYFICLIIFLKYCFFLVEIIGNDCWPFRDFVFSFVFKKTSKFYQRRARSLPPPFVPLVLCFLERSLPLYCGRITSFMDENCTLNCMVYNYTCLPSKYFLKVSMFIHCSKILSLIASFFSSTYATKWKEFFPQKELKCPPSFHARVISCASLEVLQVYLAWRQNACEYWKDSFF